MTTDEADIPECLRPMDAFELRLLMAYTDIDEDIDRAMRDRPFYHYHATISLSPMYYR